MRKNDRLTVFHNFFHKIIPSFLRKKLFSHSLQALKHRDITHRMRYFVIIEFRIFDRKNQLELEVGKNIFYNKI